MSKNNKTKSVTTPTQNFITGVLAGISDVAITHPLWTLQILRQDGLSAQNILGIVKKDPVVLYKGALQNAGALVPLTAIRILLSSTFENYADKNSINEPGILTKLGSSFLAGGVSSLISSPTELIRTIKVKSSVLQHATASENFFNIANHYVQKEGVLNLFKGVPTVAIRDGLYTAAFFGGPQIVKEIINPYFKNPIASTLVSFSFTSIIASFVNTPFDTIKTAQHLSQSESYLIGSSETGSFSEACKKIYNTDGLKGFYKGYAARGTRLSVGLIIKASIIEKMDEYWSKHNENDCGNNTNSLLGCDSDDPSDSF